MTHNHPASYLRSLALIGAVYSTSIVENATYETLVFVVVWALILLGGVIGAVFYGCTINARNFKRCAFGGC